MGLVGILGWYKGKKYNYSFSEKSKSKSYLFLLLLLNLVYYSVSILSLPGFTTDDFYIFYVVSKNSVHPFSFDPDEIFFLFLRPVSYFSFWVDYHLFHDNSFLMKFISLGLHLCLVTIIFNLLHKIADYTGLTKNNLLIFFVVLLFSSHPDVLLYIIHINNRTELLMILFYSSALLVTIKYLSGEIRTSYFVTAVSIFYILSVLSKQNGLHLPLLLVICALCKRHLKQKKIVLILTGLVLFSAAAAFSYLNHILIQPGILSAASLYRKPFSAVGILLTIMIPSAAGIIYGYFFLHKLSALFTAIPAITILFVLLWKFPVFRRHFTRASGIIFIVFYPRIFALGGGRINTHITLWLLIILTCYLLRYYVKLKYVLISVYAAAMFIMNIQELRKNISANEAAVESISALQSLAKQFYPKKICVLLCKDAAFSYRYNYFTRQEFGLSGIEGFPLIYKYLLPDSGIKDRVITSERKKDFIRFTTREKTVFICENPVHKRNKVFDLHPVGEPDREYTSYAVVLPEKKFRDYVPVFFNGSEWELVK